MWWLKVKSVFVFVLFCFVFGSAQTSQKQCWTFLATINWKLRFIQFYIVFFFLLNFATAIHSIAKSLDRPATLANPCPHKKYTHRGFWVQFRYRYLTHPALLITRSPIYYYEGRKYTRRDSTKFFVFFQLFFVRFVCLKSTLAFFRFSFNFLFYFPTCFVWLAWHMSHTECDPHRI